MLKDGKTICILNAKKWRTEKLKIISLLIGATLLFSLCACAATQSEGQTAEISQGSTWQEQYDLGVRYLSEGNYEEAIIAFTSAIEIDPKQAQAYVGRGDACVLLGETEDNLIAAKADYETALSIDETLVEAYQNLAQLYLTLDESDNAVKILKQGYALTGDEALRKALDSVISKASDEGSNGYDNNGIVNFLGKTMEDVVERYGNEYSAGNYEGSTYIAYEDIATFFFGAIVEYPDNNAVINIISLSSSESLTGNLTGAMTYPELVDAVGEETKLEQPDYSYNEMEDYGYYSTEFVYQGYNVSYEWFEDPETNISTDVIVSKRADTFEQPHYEPDMAMITERFKRVGRNYLAEVLSIPDDAGFQFTNIEYESDILWSMDCYSPTDNGLRIYAIFELDPWNDRATITPGWGGDFEAEFSISKYDH